MPKKIVVITGSSHQGGTSARLADAFIKGLDDRHEVTRFDAGMVGARHHDDLVPQYVDRSESAVPVNDSIQKLIPKLVDAEMIVLVTPLYYYGPTAQLKAVIDRFYAYNHAMKGKDSAILATAFDPVEKFKALDTWYDILCPYMRWHNRGRIYAGQAWSQLDKYLEDAYELGKQI